MVEIREMKGKKDIKKFAKFPAKLYKDCPQWVPDLIADEMDNFNPKKNPAFEFCEAKCFMAYKNGKPVGRIAAIISHKANEKWETKRIRMTRIDFIDDFEVSRALIDAVENWGREKGLNEIHGPIGFCDLDQEGMIIEGFEHPSMFITIYNYPYYINHMEKMGFLKDTDWVEFKVFIPEKPDERIERLSNIVLKRSKLRVVRPKNKKELKKFIGPVFDVVNTAYKNLYGVVELTDALVEKYINQFLILVNVQYIRIIIDQNDKVVGFGFGIPSLSEASKKSNGKLFPLGWYRLLRAPYKKKTIFDLYLVAVLPEMQKCGLTAVLLNEMTKVAIESNMIYAETGPELEWNENVISLWKSYETEQHKRRRCWIKKIEA